MTFNDFLKERKISIYQLSLKTEVPYSTLMDLVKCKTLMSNLGLEKAIKIANALNIKPEDLLAFDVDCPYHEFSFFRSSLLHDLKRIGDKELINKIIREREIDFWYKHGSEERAYYLLALIDYLSKENGLPIYGKRYNKIRKEKLSKPFFPATRLVKYESLKEAEDDLHIRVLEEFAKFNIIEENIRNVV